MKHSSSLSIIKYNPLTLTKHNSYNNFLNTKLNSRSNSISNNNSPSINYEILYIKEKLRELQLEISILNRDLIRNDEEHNKLALLLSRRFSILSNILLWLWCFIYRSGQAFRTRIRTGLLSLLIPRSISNSNTLLSYGIEAIICGLQYSFPFLISSYLLSRYEGWKRNVGFLISTLHSLFLASKDIDSTSSMHYFSIFFNVAYIVCRYYYLHGLLSFQDWACNIH